MVNVQDVDVINMKKIIFLIILFLIYSAIICFCPVVTQWDRNIIMAIQDLLKNVPLWIPMLLDTQIYASCIIIPLIIGFIFFYKRLLIIDLLLFSSAPLVAYILNSIIKIVVQRPRPPFELQIAVHPSSFSFVSICLFLFDKISFIDLYSFESVLPTETNNIVFSALLIPLTKSSVKSA